MKLQPRPSDDGVNNRLYGINCGNYNVVCMVCATANMQREYTLYHSDFGLASSHDVCIYAFQGYIFLYLISVKILIVYFLQSDTNCYI